MNFLLIISSAVSGTIVAIGTGNLYNDIFYLAVFIVMIAVLASAITINKALKAILKVTMPELTKEDEVQLATKKEAKRTKRQNAWNRLIGLKPIEEEKNLVMEDHEYDGIAELNNPIPIWFNALFYSTVTFAVVYLLIYHVFGWGLNPDQEYEQEMATAEIEKQEYLAQSANLIDENSIVADETGTLAINGKAIFATNCVACHGANGEGGIGPNLADRFWLHGGEIKDIFKTVKYGVPDKGMVPWEQTLTPAQIAEVSNYILTFRDTNPANPKAAEGKEVVAYEGEGGAGESTEEVIVQDSTENNN